MLSHREQGSHAEKLALHYLQQQGLKLLECNYYSRFGEIDLIMQDKQYLVFVEVRYRKNTQFGSGSETVTLNKQSKLLKTASIYLQQHSNMNKYPARFDVVSMSGKVDNLSFDWIQDAFQL